MTNNSLNELTGQLKYRIIDAKMQEVYIPQINKMNKEECISFIREALKQKTLKANLRSIWRGEVEAKESSTDLSLEQEITLNTELSCLRKLSLTALQVRLADETKASMLQNAFVLDWIEGGC
jgi:hypothetical protein